MSKDLNASKNSAMKSSNTSKSLKDNDIASKIESEGYYDMIISLIKRVLKVDDKKARFIFKSTTSLVAGLLSLATVISSLLHGLGVI